MNSLRNEILQLVQSIDPLDALEENHIADVCQWIHSGEEIILLTYANGFTLVRKSSA
jgi:hypothetical protein